MPIGRIRDLSSIGVISDVDSYNLPANAFSAAINVRFENSSILRSPVFRTVPFTLAYADPRFVGANSPATGYDSVILGYLNGQVTSYKSGTETNISISGYANNSSDTPYTMCRLADVLYVNRIDRVPWKLDSDDADMVALANWTSTDRAAILRACSGALCAFNITKTATVHPQMVKTSEFVDTIGTVPTTWDHTVLTNNATENILGEMDGGIVDAQNLGEGIVIYGRNEAWSMVMDGSDNVWRYDRIFSDAGAINANCSVEVNKRHYVFGLTDIYMHDGVSKVSIINGKNKSFVFNNINLSKAHRCFVAFDQGRNELRFNYVSGDGYNAFLSTNAEGCNRSAVYNLLEETWTFDDLPYVFGAARANLDTIQTWASVTATWDTIGGTWNDQDDSIKKVLCMVGNVSTPDTLTAKLYAVDTQGPGSTIAYAVDTNATQGVTLERNGIDLDELVDLRGYKVVNSIYPQARLEEEAEPLEFSFGGADHFNNSPAYSDYRDYDGDENYKLDYNITGRFLSMRMRHDDYRYFKLTGFDLDVDADGDI